MDTNSSPRELLALRKQVLVARASLQRLRIRRDAAALQESLRWPRAAAALAASPRGLSVTFALLLAVARLACSMQVINRTMRTEI